MCIQESDCVIEDLCISEKCDLYGSDHRPLTWSVPVLREYELPTIVRWNINRLKIPDYTTRMSKVMFESFTDALSKMLSLEANLTQLIGVGNSGLRSNSQTVVNEMYDLFLSWVNLTCDKSIGKAYFDIETFKDKKLHNDKIDTIHSSIHSISSEITHLDPKTSQFHKAYSRLESARGYYKEVCRERQYEIKEEFIEEMAKKENRSEFQKRVSSMKKRDARSTCQLDPVKLDIYASYFDTTFGAKPRGKSVTLGPGMYMNAESCSIDLSAECITKTLGSRFKNGKAAGPDCVYTEILLHERELTGQLLAVLFNVCYKYAVIPSDWCKANVCLVYKKKGDIHEVPNYRPISITCVVRRLYERMMLQYLVPCTEGFLHASQGGFRPKRSTLQQCYALHEIMNAHPDAIHVFLDIKAAYDCVNRKILWHDMEKYGVNKHMISVCRSLLDNNVANLVVNGQRSRDIKCRRGLLQGSSLSPLLFNVYINILIVRLYKYPKLCNKGVETNNLFFADDGALHGQSIRNTQMMLDECSAWGEIHK